MDADHQQEKKKNNSDEHTQNLWVCLRERECGRVCAWLVLNVQSLDHACIIYLARYNAKTIMSIVAYDSHSFYRKKMKKKQSEISSKLMNERNGQKGTNEITEEKIIII